MNRFSIILAASAALSFSSNLLAQSPVFGTGGSATTTNTAAAVAASQIFATGGGTTISTVSSAANAVSFVDSVTLKIGNSAPVTLTVGSKFPFIAEVTPPPSGDPQTVIFTDGTNSVTVDVDGRVKITSIKQAKK